MKEIIDGLNLPKQILDKTEKFMAKLFGSATTEYGEIFADKVRFRRLKNQIKIFPNPFNNRLINTKRE